MKTRGRYVLRLATRERRKVTCLEKLIDDLSMEAAELEEEIALEEAKAGIDDPKHFAYPAYARAAVLRRDNLRRSVAELRLRHARVNQ